MDDDRPNGTGTRPAMHAPALWPRKARQDPARQKGLKKQKPEGNDPRKASHDVGRIAPGQERAGCCCEDRYSDGQNCG